MIAVLERGQALNDPLHRNPRLLQLLIWLTPSITRLVSADNHLAVPVIFDGAVPAGLVAWSVALSDSPFAIVASNY